VLAFPGKANPAKNRKQKKNNPGLSDYNAGVPVLRLLLVCLKENIDLAVVYPGAIRGLKAG